MKRADESTPAMETLRESLRTRIERSGIKSGQIEEALGWSHGVLRNLMTGYSQIRLPHVEALAPILDTTPLELLVEAYAPHHPKNAPSLVVFTVRPPS